MHAVFGEYIKYSGGPLRVGAVIEGQRRQWPVSSHISDRSPTGTNESIDGTVRYPLDATLVGERVVHRNPRGDIIRRETCLQGNRVIKPPSGENSSEAREARLRLGSGIGTHDFPVDLFFRLNIDRALNTATVWEVASFVLTAYSQQRR
jgi:hypothetical protein